MNLKLMRDLDTFLGGFFVLIINGFSLFKVRSRPVLPGKQEEINILFIKFFGAGSIILSTPMAKGLKKLYPNAKIVLLTFQENQAVGEQLPAYSKIIIFRKDSFGSFSVDLVRNLFLIWRMRPQIVLDGEFFSNFTNLFSWMTFAKIQVGFHLRRVSRGKTFSHKVSLNTHKHITHVFYALAASVGARYEDVDLTELEIKLPDQKDVTIILSKLNMQANRPVVVINPNASHTSYLRRWPAEYFISLVSEMIAKYPDFYYVFVGSGSEGDYVERIVKQLPFSAIRNSAGKLSVGELLALIYKSTLVITNDSLPLHVASAFKKNVVSFFGPETPRFYGPFHKNALTYFEDIPCSPCLITFDNKAESGCMDNICLKKITPQRVFGDIESFFFNNGI